jgi:serine/threonine-protein kinase
VALPARIGRYRILGLLGRGAMGVVYRGRDDGLDRDVAVKVMALADDTPEGRDRFLREARSAARLQHPNIVTLYELGDHEGAPFMAMELLEGVDLQRALAAEARLDPRVALAIVLQVLAGLGHAHDHGVVHRDVKPSNVFLPRGRPAKVMDFGVARVAGGTTAAGVMVGTPNYMSPEQVRTGLVDGRSDLFSAGLILYEVIAGEKAYQADNIVSLLYKIAHEDPPLGSLPEGPQWARLRQVVARSLAREPDDRYPDARAMSVDLGQALVDLGGSPHGVVTAAHGLSIPEAPVPPTAALPLARPAVAPPSEPRATVESSRRMAWALLAVAALALVGGLGLFLHLRAPEEEPAAGPSPIAPQRSAEAPAPPPSMKGPAAAPAPATPSPLPPSASAAPTAAPSPVPVAAPIRPTSSEQTSEEPEAEARPGADAARLERANDLFDRGRFAAALSEARAVLRRNPGNAEARTLVEDAEAAVVVEEHIKKARDALRKGDPEKALQEVRAGLVVAPSDGRLLELFKEATR